MEYTEITSFEAACKVTGNDPNKLPDVSMLEPGMQKFVLAATKLAIITKAINGNKYCDFADRDTFKYEPWFQVDKSGLGFSITSYAYWRTLTLVGSRLCFISRDRCLFAIKQFEDLYKDMILINE